MTRTMQRPFHPWFTVLGSLWLGLSSAAAQASPPLEAFAASDAVRVFEDGYGLPEKPPREIQVFGLRNEILSAQCFVRANEELKGLTVKPGLLRNSAASSTIPQDAVQWNFVDSIAIKENTPKLVKSDLSRPAPAKFPDVLSEERQCTVSKGTLKAIYLTIAVPPDAAPGDYRGEVTIQSGAASATLPLSVTVYPVTMPDERHLMVTEWFSTHHFQKHHGIGPDDSEASLKLLARYAENMAEHRQNVFRVSLNRIASSRAANGKLSFDFADFDQWAEVFWKTGRMDLLETGFVAHFSDGHWSSTAFVFDDFRVKDEVSGKTIKVEGAKFLPEFLPAFVAHLREKKWLEKTVFHISDEPSNHNVMSWREASDFVHRFAPELRRIDAIETAHCLDRLEIWVPKLDHLSTWEEAYEDARRRGNELWQYTVGIYQAGSLPNKTVDVPLIESRILHWLNYRYDWKGYLHWGWNSWTDDPVGAPGQHRGDGWHVYPKKGGVLNSLRWEQMRNGLQDYECLWLLESKIAALKATLSPRVAALIDPRRRGVEIATQVVRSCSDFTREPEVLYAARRQAIEEAAGLELSPRMIIQTNPPEHSSMANNCSIDLHGWAEPGSVLEINGHTVPVGEDGLFLADSSPSKEGAVVVKATKGEATKTFTRKFRLRYEPRTRGRP